MATARRVLIESIPVLLVAGTLSLVAGIVLERSLDRFLAFSVLIVLLPGYLSTAGALGGILSNVPAIERKIGLEAAIAANGNVELLDFQPADWNETKAFEITQTWLTRFGRDIKGVWAANDSMAIGALEALRQEGLAGVVPVTGIDGIEAVIEATKAGEMAGTVAWDPLWTGGMGLSIAYHSAVGKIDIVNEPRSHREFYGTSILITQANVNDLGSSAALDYTDYWGKATGQIQYR